MTKDSFLIFLGALVVLATFLGVPSSWKTIIFNILGLLIIVTALLLRKDITSGAICTHLTAEKHTDSYTQSSVLTEHNENSETRTEDPEKHNG